jgi:hypothetical protein
MNPTIATLQHLGQFFEAGMLICFGLGWPISILKSWRTKFVRGKSLGFLLLIETGYVCGIGNKLLRALHGGVWPELVTVFYLFNAVLVAVDILLFLRYRDHPAPCER